MRSARMILATTAATAALAFAAPGAQAAVAGDWDNGGRDDSSYSKEHNDDSSHEGPRGGMHTGGGVLAVAKLSSEWESDSGNDSKFDPETYKDKGDDQGGKGDSGDKEDSGGKGNGGDKEDSGGKGNGGDKEDSGGKGDRGSGEGRDQGGSWGDDEDSGKPHGGMHTGGGGLATPGVTTGGLAVLGVAAAGAYALRRRNTAGSVS
ncbi:hypothetical protein ABZ642_39730 [Streptomyces sp. NPDC007157]|uniref:hypothetical protein n=1 Tax=Streptomyces sp. NPDC007157 TaxID=3154681 RepID=UPI0033C3157E